MSYCRWSSDNWSCDLYCYEDVSGGWTTHVASNRILGDIPKLLPWPELSEEELDGDPADVEAKLKPWFDAYRAQLDYTGSAERKPIGLPHDGETFEDATLDEFRDRLLMLRGVGYNVPEHVFEEIGEELKQKEMEK